MSVVSSTKYFCDRCGAEIHPVNEFMHFRTKPVFITAKKTEAHIVQQEIQKMFEDARGKAGDEEVLRLSISVAYSVNFKDRHLCSKCSKAFYEFMRSER